MCVCIIVKINVYIFDEMASVFQAPNNQVLYSAVGDQSAMQYFDVNENSGRVFIRQPLYTGTSSQYLVSTVLFVSLCRIHLSHFHQYTYYFPYLLRFIYMNHILYIIMNLKTMLCDSSLISEHEILKVTSDLEIKTLLFYYRV